MTRPNPVCISCAREMRVHRVGVIVQFNALSVGGPYVQWHADTVKCDGCGNEVAARYADAPSWHHYSSHAPELPHVIVEEVPRGRS